MSNEIEDGTIKLLPDEKKEEFENCNTWSNETKAEFFDYALKNISAFKDIGEAVEQFKASKQRKPLFVTEDGFKIFDNITVYRVNEKFDILPIDANKVNLNLNGERKTFCIESAAREYVMLNKPMYSLNDIGDAWEKLCHEAFTYDQLITELEKLKP